ncbi:hypothetical protein NMG60_11000441 [Bertholletia excelsa]
MASVFCVLLLLSGVHLVQMRDKSADKRAYRMADERDIRAALILVEMANQSCLPASSYFTVQRTDSELLNFNKLMVDGIMKNMISDKLSFSIFETNHMGKNWKKRKIGINSSTTGEENGKGLSHGCGLNRRLVKKSQQSIKDFIDDDHDGLTSETSESKKMRKRQVKADGCNHLNSVYKRLTLESESGLQQLDAEAVPLSHQVLTDKDFLEDASMEDVSLAKSRELSWITPTICTGFSFCIIHLLSAVRGALITPCVECIMQKQEVREKSLPFLTIDEIVQLVRLKPGDPRILKTEEPLVDLVRGVLKIFSSKTSPLGAKGWRPLVSYSISKKGWSWTGPVSMNSPKAWDLSQELLMELVDCFANWLKNDQETLKLLGSLPAPPMVLMQNTNTKERFEDLRAKRSLCTISPSSDEIRAYFQREEALRYQLPERAFAYTALDGIKSTVAPLSVRRCSGKPLLKARGHFMLKQDRPPHVTILCLVRDAAARLPGRIGTRADVCTLVRDSQFIVEDISDLQMNQVVSGALDRLHYELDPCVQYNKERHLWVYLHGEREEEDFVSEGASKRKYK